MKRRADASLHRGLGARRQRGAIIAFAAMAISLVVIMLSAADMGFLYYYKRDYQNAADLAAMAGARELVSRSTGLSSCSGNAVPAAEQNAAQNLGSRDYSIVVECGRWHPSGSTEAERFDRGADADQINAVRVEITGQPPRFLPYVNRVTLSAHAVSMANQALASLRIRSSLISVDTSRSATLNALFGGLLGGTVSLNVGAWNGLLNTDISLLDYLDQLAVNLNLQAGQYDQVLASNVSVGNLLEAAITLLDRGEGTGSVSAALGGLEVLQASIPPATPLLQLGDIVSIASGTQTAGLDAPLQVFQLAQALVQAANSKNALAATVNLGVASVQTKILEPPMISAVGNPELARLDPDGPGRIYVNTAQVRTLISVNLPALAGVTNLANAVLNLLSPVTTLLNNVLQLNLVGALSGLVGSLVGTPYEVTDIQLVPGNPRIDVSLDVAGGEAKVTDYECASSGDKALDTDIETSVANLRIGRLQTNPSLPGYVFSAHAPPTVSPVPLIDVGVSTCRVYLLIASVCEARRPFAGGGLGLMGQASVAGAPYTHTYANPPELDESPAYAQFATQNIVGSLANTLAGVEVQMYGPQSGGGLGGVLNLIGGAVNTVKGLLQPLISNLLSPLLDPLVNFLLNTLGIDLAKVEVGANLSCGGGGATLID